MVAGGIALTCLLVAVLQACRSELNDKNSATALSYLGASEEYAAAKASNFMMEPYLLSKGALRFVSSHACAIYSGRVIGVGVRGWTEVGSGVGL